MKLLYDSNKQFFFASKVSMFLVQNKLTGFRPKICLIPAITNRIPIPKSLAQFTFCLHILKRKTLQKNLVNK
jgi:hypothetical protein